MSRNAASSTWRYGRRIAVARDLKFGWLGRARSPASRHSPRFCRQYLGGKCEEDHEPGYELVKRLVSVLGQCLDEARFQLADVYGVVV
jgi:hypothetical protein